MKLKGVIFLIILIICFFNFGKYIYSFKDRYLYKYWDRFEFYKTSYWNSQYAIKNPVGWVPDEILYSYAAGEYLKGANPTVIQSTQPPLGKYFLSLSVLLFNNENIAIIIFGLVFLLSLFFIGKKIMRDNLFALLPILVLSFEKLFLRQFENTPLLDIIQLTFISLSILFFIKALQKKKIAFFILVSIFIGVIFGVKFFITGLILLFAFILLLIMKKDIKSLKFLLYSLTFSLLILILSYIAIFKEGKNPLDVLRIQKWLFAYHKSKSIYPFTVWKLIFLNQWQTWWGDSEVVKEVTWQLFWPLGTGISLLTITAYLFKKIQKNMPAEVVMIWIFNYLLFLSLNQANARYLLPLLPFTYVLGLWGIKEFLANFRIKFKKRTKK